jgi:hypothetical protein
VSQSPIHYADETGRKTEVPILMRTDLAQNPEDGNSQNPDFRTGHLSAYATYLVQPRGRDANVMREAVHRLDRRNLSIQTRPHATAPTNLATTFPASAYWLIQLVVSSNQIRILFSA